MKLYATTTSERASKGQGGNEFIDIQLNDENGIPVCYLRFTENGLGYDLELKDYDSPGVAFVGFPCPYCEEREKGEKQKGDKCDCNMNYGNSELSGSHDIDCNSRK